MTIQSLSKQAASKYRPSRSHAVALFIAKYFAKDDAEYRRLLGQENKVYGGNTYVYNKLIDNLERNEG